MSRNALKDSPEAGTFYINPQYNLNSFSSSQEKFDFPCINSQLICLELQWKAHHDIAGLRIRPKEYLDSGLILSFSPLTKWSVFKPISTQHGLICPQSASLPSSSFIPSPFPPYTRPSPLLWRSHSALFGRNYPAKNPIGLAL